MWIGLRHWLGAVGAEATEREFLLGFDARVSDPAYRKRSVDKAVWPSVLTPFAEAEQAIARRDRTHIPHGILGPLWGSLARVRELVALQSEPAEIIAVTHVADVTEFDEWYAERVEAQGTAPRQIPVGATFLGYSVADFFFADPTFTRGIGCDFWIESSPPFSLHATREDAWKFVDYCESIYADEYSYFVFGIYLLPYPFV